MRTALTHSRRSTPPPALTRSAGWRPGRSAGRFRGLRHGLVHLWVEVEDAQQLRVVAEDPEPVGGRRDGPVDRERVVGVRPLELGPALGQVGGPPARGTCRADVWPRTEHVLDRGNDPACLPAPVPCLRRGIGRSHLGDWRLAGGVRASREPQPDREGDCGQRCAGRHGAGAAFAPGSTSRPVRVRRLQLASTGRY